MLGVIVINYRSEFETIGFIKNELCKIKNRKKIVVINNAATKASDQILCNNLSARRVVWGCDDDLPLEGDEIVIISEAANLGFASGNNRGLEYLKKLGYIDFVLFTNNDIIICSPDCIDVMMDKIFSNVRIGLIGPEVKGLDNIRQSPEPYLHYFNRFVISTWFRKLLTYSQKQKLIGFHYSEDAKEGFHYKIMGSFFLMRLDVIINCGGFDTNTFLYGEELIISERLALIDLYPYFTTDVSVIHAHSLTISKFHNEISKLKMLLKSEYYYYKTYRKSNIVLLWICTNLCLLYFWLRFNMRYR